MKKILSLLLCVVMLCSALAVSASAASQYNPETLDEDNYDITQPVLEDDNFTLGDVN